MILGSEDRMREEAGEGVSKKSYESTREEIKDKSEKIKVHRVRICPLHLKISLLDFVHVQTL